MLPKGHAELAHPQAADWVLGALGPGEVDGFRLHLRGCPHCRAATAEFGQLGQLLQRLPPAAEPPPALEARTIASILEAVAEDRITTQVHQIPLAPPRTGTDEQPGGMAKVIRFPRWPGRTGLFAIASAVAAAIVAAALVLPGLGGGAPVDAYAFKLAPAARSAQTAASGTAMARRSAYGSWNVTLTVHHLESLHGKRWYECWYVSRDRRHALSAGTFLVPSGGSGTFTMASAADPAEFQAMEITIQSPSTGALQDTVVLSGQGHKL